MESQFTPPPEIPVAPVLQQVPETPKKNSKTWLIVLIVVLVLCCCCVVILGVLAYNYGDQILQNMNYTTSMLEGALGLI
jgi:hypothetical protein